MGEKLFVGKYTFEQIVHKFSDTVTGICVMRLQNIADSEDCYQNVFYKLYYKSPEFESEEHLKAWIIRVTIHECASYMRKNRKQIPNDKINNEYITFDDNAVMTFLGRLKKHLKNTERYFICIITSSIRCAKLLLYLIQRKTQ